LTETKHDRGRAFSHPFPRRLSEPYTYCQRFLRISDPHSKISIYESPTNNSSSCNMSKHDIKLINGYSRGDCDLFVMNGSNVLQHVRPTGRFATSKKGSPLFVRCTSLPDFPRFCAGCLIAISIKGSRVWHLGIIERLCYFFPRDDEHILRYWEASGPIGLDGHPELFGCRSVEDLMHHMDFKSSPLTSVTFYFVNQVSLLTPMIGRFMNLYHNLTKLYYLIFHM
jgi:hypothetical protein